MDEPDLESGYAGCDRVSPGCDHCYALTLAARLRAMGNPRYQRDGRPPTSGPGFAVTWHAEPRVDATGGGYIEVEFRYWQPNAVLPGGGEEKITARKRWREVRRDTKHNAEALARFAARDWVEQGRLAGEAHYDGSTRPGRRAYIIRCWPIEVVGETSTGGASAGVHRRDEGDHL